MRRDLREEVERCGLVIVEGRKHLKIMCPETNRLVGVAPHGKPRERGSDRNTKNLIATMRRYSRQKGSADGTPSSE